MATTIKGLEEKIATRADREAQRAILTFEKAIHEALRGLLGDGLGTVILQAKRTICENRAVRLAGGATIPCPWPRIIWTNAEDRLREQIISSMDDLQHILRVDETPIETPAKMEEPETADLKAGGTA